ncbi:hypothetical protein GCM10022206_58480 [Streptomyces chiangmaiensis]
MSTIRTGRADAAACRARSVSGPAATRRRTQQVLGGTANEVTGALVEQIEDSTKNEVLAQAGIGEEGWSRCCRTIRRDRAYSVPSLRSTWGRSATDQAPTRMTSWIPSPLTDAEVWRFLNTLGG